MINSHVARLGIYYNFYNYFRAFMLLTKREMMAKQHATLSWQQSHNHVILPLLYSERMASIILLSVKYNL